MKAPDATCLLERWLDFILETASERTYELYSQVARELVSSVGHPEKWKVGSVAKYLDWLREKGNSDRSRHTKLQIVRSFMRWAGESLPKGVIESVPPNIRFKASPPRVAKPTDIEELIAGLDDYPTLRLAVLLMADAGLRESEVRGLRWGDVDDGVMTIEGKGSKTRKVPAVTPRLFEALRDGLDSHKPSEYIVPDSSGGQLVRGTIGRQLKAACRRLGLTAMNPHSFRHGFAIRAVLSGIPAPLIQRALGHSSLAVTDIYLRGLDGDVQSLKEGFAGFK